MSFKQTDKSLINLGNYEEFFLLYIDGELDPAQVQMVDDFVVLHPDLHAELDLLNDTRLTPESFSFSKEELLSHHMQQNLIDEDLFLYMDNELTASQKTAVEQDLANRPDRRLQLDALMQTQLDASQAIAYPNKKELYRREERRAAFPWMRVAAAVVLIGTATVFYFNRSETQPPAVAVLPTTPVKVAAPTINKEEVPASKLPTRINTVAVNRAAVKSPVVKVDKITSDQTANHTPQQSLTQPAEENNKYIAHATSVDTKMIAVSAKAIEPSKVIVSTINNSPVTSALHDRTTMEGTTVSNSAEAPTGNEHKGTVKGFLRKATRLIEKRTGVDPTTDGDLLIGVVAVHLK